MEADAGVKEEVDERGRRPNQECSKRRDHHRSPSDERLLVVLRMHAKSPGPCTHHQAD